jgi:S-adenosylmethionine synthetase
VDTGGAGDQGLMVGFACDETKELMPTPISLAHNLTKRLAEARKKKILPYLGPDGKSQVTVEYEDGPPSRIDAVVMSSQHDVSILDRSGKKITNASREEMIEKIILPVLPKNMLDKQTKFYVNPTGKFVVGGPEGDTGVTGRKIIVDTYGGLGPPRGRRVQRKRSHQGGPLGLLHGAPRGEKYCGRRAGQAMHGSIGLRHRRGGSRQRDGGHPRNGPGAGIEAGGARSR